MTQQSVGSLLCDIRYVNEPLFELVEAIRQLARECLANELIANELITDENLAKEHLTKGKVESLCEEVKYGGILLKRSGISFAGIFAYKAHVSVEFSHGASINDTEGFLEGSGKGRRHLKLRSISDIEDKKLDNYLRLAFHAALHAALQAHASTCKHMQAQ